MNAVGVEVLKTVIMKKSVFWVTMQCSLFKISLYLGATFRLHLQGRRINQARSQHDADSKQVRSTCLMMCVFGPEDGGDVFLLKVG
jgi:hypothetical protein